MSLGSRRSFESQGAGLPDGDFRAFADFVVKIAKPVVCLAEPVGLVPFATAGEVKTECANALGLDSHFSSDTQKLPGLRNASNVAHVDGIGFLPNLLF